MGAYVTSDPTKRTWSGNDIREAFLRFFESKGHHRVRSSSLVPHGDPTLLFTNAGMNQFKDVFLGLEKRPYNKATTAQKCVRAGGKHNDLENVGFTKRHHTFFEMLGNFSFGDYFKKDAIAFAWELITSPEWFGIDKTKLYTTVFGGAEVAPGTTLGVDEEARGFWLAQSVAPDRVVPIPGLKDNFWAMGDTGPCGPCSEVFYDMGVAASEEGHADCKFPCDCGRYVEFWNLVFMQFNRDAAGTLTPLPKPCVDTGMGLERVAAILQGVISNYETDLFQPLIGYACVRAHTTYGADPRKTAALCVTADHARASSFLIADGLIPSNEGRSYVLRKIIRRACDFGRELGLQEPFLFEMAELVGKLMSESYPELGQSQQRIATTIKSEEEKYTRLVLPAEEQLIKRVESRPMISDAALSTIRETGRELGLYSNEQASKAEGRQKFESQGGRRLVHGGDFFYAYSTLGLRPDHVRDVAAARDWFIPPGEEPQFENMMAAERERGKASWKGAHKEAASPAYAKIAETFKTEKDFYQCADAKDVRIDAIVSNAGLVHELKSGESGEVVLDRTVIYAESGGQVSDTGGFFDNSGSQLLAEVSGAYYPVAGLVAHKVTAKEALRVGDRISVVADADRRARIMRNHSGTHLVHAALRNVLGTHVKQAGSLNAPDRLRFDFSHFAHVDPEELRDIEQQVNDEIRFNTQIETDVTSLEDALASGALAFFGDKYPESNVRVVTIPDERAPRGFYSKELCGGTHVHRIGDIGVLKIVGEQSVAASVRRIEAVTGIGALEHYQQQAQILTQVANQLNVGEGSVLAAVEKLSQTVKQLEKELEAQKRKGALSQLDELVGRAHTVKGVKVIAEEVANVDREGLRQLVDSLRQKLGSGVVALGMPENGKVALIAGVTKDLTSKVHAGKLIQALAKQVGGSGGGRPDLAEAGGKDTAGLKTALQAVPSLVEPLL
jgi:alanyl-tRNA synthetase